jgi:hypothetical protein
MAGCQGRAGTRAGPGPGGQGRLCAVAGMRDLPRAVALPVLPGTACPGRSQRQFSHSTMPLVLDAGTGLGMRPLLRTEAPQGRHRRPADRGGTGPRLPRKGCCHVFGRPRQSRGGQWPGPGGGHRGGRAGRRRRLCRRTVARRRFPAAPGKPPGRRGHRPPLVQCRSAGASRVRRRPGGHYRDGKRCRGRAAALGSGRLRRPRAGAEDGTPAAPRRPDRVSNWPPVRRRPFHSGRGAPAGIVRRDLADRRSGSGGARRPCGRPAGR